MAGLLLVKWAVSPAFSENGLEVGRTAVNCSVVTAKMCTVVAPLQFAAALPSPSSSLLNLSGGGITIAPPPGKLAQW